MKEQSGWQDWVAASVAGVFALEPLVAVKEGGQALVRRWAGALVEKGASLRIPGTSGRRLGDVARMSLVTRVWPGKESRLYRVSCDRSAASPEEEFLQELPITPEQVEADDRPVALLLHGFGSTTTGTHFGPLKEWLTDAATGRYGLVLGYECDTLQRRIPELADELLGHLERLGLLRGQRRIDLYTHSLGALIARWLLENPGEVDTPAQCRVRASVRRLIMAGPPNQGTPVAELGDRLLTVVRRQGAPLQKVTAPMTAAFRLPLIAALTRRVAPRLPAADQMLQVLDDIQPGSALLTALSQPGWQGNHLVLTQTWHHQYWYDPGTFAAIRAGLLERLPV